MNFGRIKTRPLRIHLRDQKHRFAPSPEPRPIDRMVSPERRPTPRLRVYAQWQLEYFPIRRHKHRFELGVEVQNRLLYL
ncbi:hypothetical protein LINGRAHAP2_LOCUS13541 [Linum grandiflorum]